MNRDWHTQIQRHMEGLSDAREATALQEALLTDPALRRLYLHYMNLDLALEAHAGAGATLRKLLLSPPDASSGWKKMGMKWGRIAAAAMLLVAAGVGARMAWRGGAAPARPFALLVAANEAVWADPNVELALRAGELPQGALRLEGGTAEFQCADGATVVMRGPAVVRFPARKRVYVEAGRVFCRCPSPDSRLSITTPSTEIVDLGTEFAVEARPDRSTRVAVLSGVVEVGKSQPQAVWKGQSAVVRGDGILAIQPLENEDFSDLLSASPSVDAAMRQGSQILRDPGFEQGLGEPTWSGTEENLQAIQAGGRSGGAVKITVGGRAHWPQCRQTIATGDVAGRLVVATVWAAPAEAALQPRQAAVLKIVFVNEQGRDFAFALRRFLDAKSSPNRFEQARVAALAPAGTRSVQFQLMFQTGLGGSGSVVFDDASLLMADPPR